MAKKVCKKKRTSRGSMCFCDGKHVKAKYCAPKGKKGAAKKSGKSGSRKAKTKAYHKPMKTCYAKTRDDAIQSLKLFQERSKRAFEARVKQVEATAAREHEHEQQRSEGVMEGLGRVGRRRRGHRH